MTVTLEPAQLGELAHAIAVELATLNAGELISATELAQRLGVRREFVYDHADHLGAIRLGDGPRARLRFRWPHVLDRMARLDTPGSVPDPPATRRRSRPRTGGSIDLLPIGGRP